MYASSDRCTSGSWAADWGSDVRHTIRIFFYFRQSAEDEERTRDRVVVRNSAPRGYIDAKACRSAELVQLEPYHPVWLNLFYSLELVKIILALPAGSCEHS